MKWTVTRTSAIAFVLGLALPACSSGGGSSFGNGGNGNGGSLGSGNGNVLGSGAGQGDTATVGDGGTATIQAIIRDFRFYDPSNSSTNPDFENVPATLDGTGQTVAPNTYFGPWDDKVIVADRIGSDGKPAYRNPGQTTLTTHGQSAFNQWYNDVSGTNFRVIYPLPLTPNQDGSFTYDSNVSGQPYNIAGVTGDGFFPIDDGSQYATPFGDQGRPHNYSFTMEIHTVFNYGGGERFDFRGDDDVFVFIDGKLVINVGGIHGPETASVQVDSLGLTKGATYNLDFFSAERHVTGSNIEFTTTIHLVPVPPPK
jgi:fibro-slime domain-containing protein